MFHLMPYRFLPSDFENRYRSVWVDVPHELYDARQAGRCTTSFSTSWSSRRRSASTGCA